MPEILLQIFLGWPSMILSMGFALAGIFFKKSALSLVGGTLIMLPAWYLSHYSILFASLPLFLFGSAYEISKGKNRLAFLAMAPAMILIGGVGLAVLMQFH